MSVVLDGICHMGATSWLLQNAQISLEKLCEIKWCIEALCFHGHGIAWMHTFRNTGIYAILSLTMQQKRQ